MANKEEQLETGAVIGAETFRDSVSTVDQSGARKWVYPKKPKGKFTNYRDIVTVFLLAVFFVVPFIKLNGNPLLKINIIDREFFIIGQPFYPQDFFILALGAITSLVFIILFTVVFGRIFCGWICPQTIFMEGVFRKIEYWIEGDRNKQIKLANQPWNSEKILKKGLKWFIYTIISLIITHWMFMYIVGYEEVLKIMKGGPIEYPSNFIVMFIFTGLFYFVFAWFREQVCTLVCPYGRLQGVLIDKETINVFYDFKRGENRSKWRKGEDRKAAGKGDCIDCNQCVVVCPTGIDIRNGQQLECINCTMCIDACDEVMVKTGLPKGLIRYASQDEIEKEQKFKFTNRMKAYSVVLLALVGFLGYLLNNRGELEAKFIKPAGSTFFIKDKKINNTYNYTFLNKTNEDKKVTIKVIKPQNGEIILSDNNSIILKRDKLTKGTVNVTFPEIQIKQSKQNITIGVYDDKGKLLDTFDTYFEGLLKCNSKKQNFLMKKFTWGHGIAIALGSFICFILYLILIFPIGKQNSELVTESYYEDELAYQKVIDAKANADNQKTKPFFAQLPYGIRIAFPKEIIDANSKIEYYLYRTNDKTQDKSQKINLDSNNSFLIPKTELIPGSYTLKIMWTFKDKDYQVDYDVIWK